MDKSNSINKRPMKTLILLSTTLLCSIFLLSFDADPSKSLQKIIEKLRSFQKDNSQDYVYLHIDRPFYKPGDDIWFKAYLTDAEYAPNKRSEVVYVELINPKGAVETKLTLLTSNGSGFGDFKIPNSAPGGIYKVKAYTNWMKNFGEDNCFEKKIQVQKVILPRVLMKLDFQRKAYGAGDRVLADFELNGIDKTAITNKAVDCVISLNGNEIDRKNFTTNAEGKTVIDFTLPQILDSNDGIVNIVFENNGFMESISRAIPIILNDIDLQFFPEGGSFVANIKNKIAFKAINEFGKAADVKGAIVDDAGQEVTSFDSYHNGMGACEFTPKRNKKYFAKISQPVGIETQYPLPQPSEDSYAIQLSESTKDKLVLNIHKPNSKEASFVAQIKGKEYFARDISNGKNEQTVEVDLKEFPIGIVQLTLFDHESVPQSERLVFVNKHRQLNIDINTNKDKYLPREKVEASIQVKDELGKSVQGDFSVSVVNESLLSFADDKQDNILSSLLLSSDLKGEIEEPAFYFNEKEEKSTEALDLVMMTNGWRGFEWKEVLEENLSKEKEHLAEAKTIKGKLVSKIDCAKEPQKIIIKETGEYVLTNENCEFEITDVDLDGKPITLICEVGEETVSAKVYDYNNNLLLRSSIGGSVLDKDSKKPIPYVNIYFEGGRVGTVSDLDGNFELKNIPTDADKVIIYYEGSKPLTISINDFKIEAKENVFYIKQNRFVAMKIRAMGGRAGNNKNRAMEKAAAAGPQGAEGPQAMPMMVEDEAMEERADAAMVPQDGQLFNAPPPPPQAPAMDMADDREMDFENDMDAMDVMEVEEPAPIMAGKRRALPPPPTTPVWRYFKARTFYEPKYETEDKNPVRDDFRKTIYWNPELKTDEEGIAKFSFYTSDEITQFKIISEGVGEGSVGMGSESIYSQLPFSIDFKTPKSISFDDVIDFDAVITNNTDKAIEGNFMIQMLPLFDRLKKYKNTQTIPANSTLNVPLSFKTLSEPEDGSVVLSFIANGLKDIVKKEFKILPTGFPATFSKSGSDLKTKFDLDIRDMVNGSLDVKLTAYPNILDGLMSGVDGMFRQPSGCFEQTSSATYPNIVALKYLMETGELRSDVQEKAMGFIESGYKRLVSYETKEDGFEWFGKTPPHEGLTAYGLMEFVDMQKVYDGVDQKMIDRTAKWLMSRRNDKGGFDRNAKALDTFGRADEDVHNAYIVYALAHAGYKDIEKQFETALKIVKEKDDAYRTALLANAAFDLDKDRVGEELLKKLHVWVDKIDLEKEWKMVPCDHSITRSGGVALDLETVALTTLAELKKKNPDQKYLQKVVDYFSKNRSGGRFGSTQSTILVLKALTEFAKQSKKTESEGTIKLLVDGKEIKSLYYPKGSQGELVIDGIEEYVKEGSQNIEIVFEGTKEALPFSMDANWNTFTPNNDEECKLELQTKLQKEKSRVGETVRLSIDVASTSNKGLAMGIVKVGIPSGLSAQPWQLKKLQEENQFSYYEIWDNYVVLYYRDFVPKAKHTVNFDLKAEVEGQYLAPASSAYLYYTDEYKNWSEGNKISIISASASN